MRLLNYCFLIGGISVVPINALAPFDKRTINV